MISCDSKQHSYHQQSHVCVLSNPLDTRKWITLQKPGRDERGAVVTVNTRRNHKAVYKTQCMWMHEWKLSLSMCEGEKICICVCAKVKVYVWTSISIGVCVRENKHVCSLCVSVCSCVWMHVRVPCTCVQGSHAMLLLISELFLGVCRGSHPRLPLCACVSLCSLLCLILFISPPPLPY